MAGPAFVQQNTVATTTSGPATIVASLGGASTLGNFLVLIVQVVSSAANAAITTPVGWTLIASIPNAGGTGVLAIYTLPNNGGGITTVTVTITTTTGSAVATMYEFSGMGSAPPTEVNLPTTGTSNGASVPPANQYPPPSTIGAVWIYAIGCLSTGTWTPVNNQLFSAAQTGVATTATALARLACFFAFTNGPGTIQEGGTLTNAVVYMLLVMRFGGTSGPIGYGPAGVTECLAGNSSPNMQGSFSNG